MSAPGDGDHPFVAAPPLVASEVAFIAVCLTVTPAQGAIVPGTWAGGSAGGCTSGLCRVSYEIVCIWLFALLWASTHPNCKSWGRFEKEF